jgi:hypothetical protein
MPYVNADRRAAINALLAGGQKRCYRCGEIKPVLDFNRRALDKTGFASECRACDKKHHASSWRAYQNRKAAAAQDREREEYRAYVSRLDSIRSEGVVLSPQYIAGFFDGEGWITIARSSSIRWKGVGLRTGIGHTNREILECLQLMFGGSLLDKKMRPDSRWKPQFQLTLTGKNAEDFLLCIRPFVVLKKPQLELALSFLKYKRLPKDQRFDVTTISAHWRNGEPGHIPHWKRKPEVVDREFQFRTEMMELNKRGA